MDQNWGPSDLSEWVVKLDSAGVVKLDLKLVKLDHPVLVKLNQSLFRRNTPQHTVQLDENKGLNWIKTGGPSNMSKQVVKLDSARVAKLDLKLIKLDHLGLVKLNQSLFR